MARILLTGATGFIGRHIYRLLMASDHDVVPTCGHLINLLDPADVDLLLDKTRPDCLIANAWMATPKIFWDDPSNPEWELFTKYLVSGFYARGGQQCIFVSSMAAAEHQDTPYGRCKRSVEDFLGRYKTASIVRVGYPKGNAGAQEVARTIVGLVANPPKIPKEFLNKDGKFNYDGYEHDKG